jgi:hypothetical protein
MDISSSNPTVIVSLGNVFPNDQIFTGATGAYTLTSLGDRTFDAGNNPQRMPNKMQQALTLEAQLDVFGAITTGSNLSAAGNLTVVGGATIGGAAAITGAITGASASVTGNLHSGGAFDVAGTAAIGSTISVGGETAQAHLLSGTYTPTLTNVANISASHMIEDASYVQVGKEIVVSGRINLTPTAGGNVTTEIDLTVPILNSSNVDAMGGAVTSGAVGLSGVATFGVSFGNGNKIRLVASQVTNTSAIDYSFIISYHLA